MATTRKTTTTRKKPAAKATQVEETKVAAAEPKTDGLVEVVVNKTFNDKQTNQIRRKGETMTITQDRLAEITSKNATLVSVVESGQKAE